MNRLSASFSLAVALSVGAPAYAATSHVKPVPGGANQAAGTSGTFGQKLFNGEVRLVPREIRNATAADNATIAAGQKFIVFTASASNGTSKALNMQQFNASIADSDGDTVQASPDRLLPMGGVFGVVPGGQWKETIQFAVPENFIPVKIVILPYDGKHPGFRITVRSSDYKPA